MTRSYRILLRAVKVPHENLFLSVLKAYWRSLGWKVVSIMHQKQTTKGFREKGHSRGNQNIG
jgi:hypothetical protein